MDTRLLLASFEKGGQDGVWLLSDGDLSLEVGTNVKYAKWVNDGHKANPDGVASRFIPGKWVGDRFIYDPNAKEGMVLKQQFILHYLAADDLVLQNTKELVAEPLDEIRQLFAKIAVCCGLEPFKKAPKI